MRTDELNKITGMLGEHFRHYVLIASHDDSPLSYDVRFSDPYAAKGLLESATEYHESYITNGAPEDLDGVQWITIEEDDEDDETEYYYE
jgi:hypothetical protein|tara:strand:- start:296 stop:562 length:267 start_codon:yes stop_codon:yes gene_type:complete